MSTWLITGTESGEVIGECGWKGDRPVDGVVEIGYHVIGRARGRGIGTDAVRALVEWTFDQPGVVRIVAETRPENIASRRILERLAFVVTDVTDNAVWYARHA